METQRLKGRGVWEHFTVRDGLPDMKIECLFQDSTGIYWIGTENRGVVRYNGDLFQAFTRKDGLAGNGVFSIIEDQDGFIWFGTNQGLSSFDGLRFEVIATDFDCCFLWGSYVDSGGNIWFGLDRRPGLPGGICRWNGRKLELIEVDGKVASQGISIHSIVEDFDGIIWAGGIGLYKYNPDFDKFDRVFEQDEDFSLIHDLYSHPDKSLWIATYKGLKRYNKGNVDNFLVDQSEMNVIVSILEVENCNYWLVTYDGKVIEFDNNICTVIYSLNTTFIGGLYLDNIGRVWVGTFGMGLYIYDETRYRVYTKENGLPSDIVNCITEDEDGKVWVGTNNGISIIENDKITNFKKFNYKNVSSIAIDTKGQIWSGYSSGNIHVYNTEGHHVRSSRFNEIDDNSINKLSIDKFDRTWFCSRFGNFFGYFDKDNSTLFQSNLHEEYPDRIGDLEEDIEGGMWFGLSSPNKSSLIHYKVGEFRGIESISGISIFALTKDLDGNLWIGTNEGLLHYNISEDKVVTFNQSHGLSYEIITDIFQADDGKVWIGTDGGGVCCFDGEIFQIIQNPEKPACNVIRCIIQDKNGKLWFGTEMGLVQYTPRKATPEVSIVEIKADEVYNDSAEVQFSTTVGRVIFNFRGRSPLEHSSYLTYRYRLLGYDKEWNQTRETSVEFPQLKFGDYTFEVQAIDRDFNYSAVVQVNVIVTEDPHIEALNEALKDGTTQEDFIGESGPILAVKQHLKEAAQTDLTVLILGETGTGKGLAAYTLHALSDRKNGPFIKVDCGGLKDLIDSELFGHEKGAFTGAITKKLGKFELADQGTIFLDEIGDLPIEAQTRLLNVLQDHSIGRVGGIKSIPINIRVVAATNRDLVSAVRKGHFRADLYYRLNVVPIKIPPLRDRKEDLPLLSDYILYSYTAHLNQRKPRLSSEILDLLDDYDWPGNVRELEHTLQRAVMLAKGETLQVQHIILGPPSIEVDIGIVEDSSVLPFAEFERRYLAKVLEITNGVIHGEQGAAKLLEIKPTTLRSRMERLGVRKPSSN